MKPVIGITMGDPSGIGPEIVLKVVLRKSIIRICRPIIFGDFDFLRTVAARVLKIGPLLRGRLVRIQPTNLTRGLQIGVMDVGGVDVTHHRFGVATVMGGKASGAYIAAAVSAAKKKWIDAIVTAPINKFSFRMGGWGKRYVGHTEMLAALTSTRRYALMLVWKQLRSIYVTSHVPLKSVGEKLRKERIIETIQLAELGVKSLGVRKPRIAVCALNPHGGDGGILGSEESRLIAPAIRNCRKRGINVYGPFSPDTVWPRVLEGEFDIGVAMYHDQGQIPVKLMSFRYSKNRHRFETSGVNITVGLPFVRTSVDHGTAYDIAGRGIASEQSLIHAIELAVKMVNVRQ